MLLLASCLMLAWCDVRGTTVVVTTLLTAGRGRNRKAEEEGRAYVIVRARPLL